MHVDFIADDRPEIIRDRIKSFLGGKEGRILVIDVYMDESNIHSDAKGHVTVAAAWADADVWADWTKDWLDAIHPMSVWHSNEIHNFSGIARGMSNQTRDALVIRAMAVIRKHKIEGRIAHINYSHLINLAGGRVAALELVEHPYYPCFIWAAQRTMEIMKTNGIESVNFIHENNDFMEGAREHFEFLKKKRSFPDCVFRFGSKQSHPPLQCADVLAYEGKHKMANWNRPRRALEAADGNSNRIMISQVTDEQVAQLVEILTSRGGKTK